MGQVQYCQRDLLREVRPSPGIDSETGRRWQDVVQSRFHLKELRPGAAGKTEIRILFIFDPQRRADDARRSRAELGFPERIEDPAAVALLAALLRDARPPPRNETGRRAARPAA